MSIASPLDTTPGSRYRVAFSALEPDPAAANYVVLARAFGGGWKVQPQ